MCTPRDHIATRLVTGTLSFMRLTLAEARPCGVAEQLGDEEEIFQLFGKR